MTLGELIAALEGHHPATALAVGLSYPHSYRGYYQDVAFVPCGPMTVAEALKVARSALGTTYEGWKGGYYEMHEHVDVYLAQVGSTGEMLGPILLGFMLGGGAE